MLLSAEKVSKTFGHTRALKRGDLNVEAGEIHGLLGANGAGKSTLVKILAGVEQRDGGRIEIDGTELPSHITPREIRDHGISFIHQDLGLIEEMTVAENMGLGLGYPARAGIVAKAQLRREAAAHLERLGVDVSPDTELARLNGADQALVAISRAVVTGAKLIVLDEPTARLRGAEVDRLFAQLTELRRRSVGFVYVTHRLEEVFTITDRVTVLRNGETVAVSRTSDLTEEELISQIVGSQWVTPEGSAHDRVGQGSRSASGYDGGLVVSNLNTDEVSAVSLEMRPGEVVGIAAPAGVGSSLARVIAGIDRPDSGTVEFDGEPGPATPRDAVMKKIAYIPPDRRGDGLAIEMTIAENVASGAHVQTELPNASAVRRWLRRASPRRDRKRADSLVQQFDIRASGSDSLISELSGGNQQKVLLAKWLQGPLRLLILDEPTQGVDVATRHEIYSMVNQRAAEGLPVLVISSDFQELAELCDRVLIFRAGTVGTELRDQQVNQDEIAAESYRSATKVAELTAQIPHAESSANPQTPNGA